MASYKPDLATFRQSNVAAMRSSPVASIRACACAGDEAHTYQRQQYLDAISDYNGHLHGASEQDLLSDLIESSSSSYQRTINWEPPLTHPTHTSTTSPPSRTPPDIILRPDAAAFFPQVPNIENTSQERPWMYMADAVESKLIQSTSPWGLERPPYPMAGRPIHAYLGAEMGLPANHIPDSELLQHHQHYTDDVIAHLSGEGLVGSRVGCSSSTHLSQPMLWRTLPPNFDVTQPSAATSMYNANNERFHRTSIQQEVSSPVVARMLQEVGSTMDDPSWITGTLQEFNMPANVTPTRSRRVASSHSSSSHSCSFPNCHKAFDTRSQLGHHARCHVLPEDRRFLCETCDVRFLWQKDLNRHFRSQGHRTKAQGSDTLDDFARINFYCPFTRCKFRHRGFPRHDNYIRHMQKHRDPGNI